MIKAVIYDFDGTLADTLPVHLHAYRCALEKLGINGLSDKEIIENCFNKYNNKIAEHFHIDSGEFSKLYEEQQRKGLEKANLCAGIEKVLKSLKESGIRLAVGSMQWEHIVKKIAEKLGLNEYFESVRGHSESTRTKGKTFSAICSDLDVKPKEVIVLGDADSDIMGAKSIGAMSVLYYPENNEKIYPLEMLTKHNPDFVIRKHEEIFGIIEKINH